MNLPLVNNYRQLLLNDTPMIDVRAPVEFVTGSLPNAVNLPLMEDSERHQVGICYKERDSRRLLPWATSWSVAISKKRGLRPGRILWRPTPVQYFTAPGAVYAQS